MQLTTPRSAADPRARAATQRSGAAPVAITLLALFVCAWIGLALLTSPAPAPESAPQTDFSAARAMRRLQTIAAAPHPIGTAANAHVRDYIVAALSDLGLKPEIQRAAVLGMPMYQTHMAATVENIVARLPGTASTRAVLLDAHYDSPPNSPGADDNGAAVVALLEAARALKASPPLRNDIIFLFSDGEEPGLLGARAFLEGSPLAKQVGVVLNFDARGNRGPVLMYETSSPNGWLVRELAAAAPAPFAGSLFADIAAAMPNSSDFRPFAKGGMAGLNFGQIDGRAAYHSAHDTPDRVDAGVVQHDGISMLALARRFGDMALDQPQTGGDAIFFNPIGSLLLAYPASWAIPLAILAALAWLGVMALGLRRGFLGIGKLLLGALAFLIASALAAGVTQLLAPALARLRPEFTGYGDVYTSSLYLAGFVAITTALVSAAFVLLRGRIGAYNLAAGASLWWLALTIVSSIVVPDGSYLAVWPLLLGLLGMAALFATGDPERALERRWWVALLVCAAPAMLLYAPMIYLVSVSAGTALLVIPATITAMLLGLLAPQIALVTARWRWLLPGAALLLGAGCLAAAVLIAPRDAEHPKFDNAFYALDGDIGDAVWASWDAAPDEWTQQFFPAGSARTRLPGFFPYLGTYMVHAAPKAALAAPEARLIEDRTAGGVRTVRLRVRSARQAPVLLIHTSGPQVTRAAVGGLPIVDDAGVVNGQWDLAYMAPPAEGIELSLELSDARPLVVRLVDRTEGLPDLPGTAIAPRPSYLASAPSMGVYSSGFYSDSTLVGSTFTFNP